MMETHLQVVTKNLGKVERSDLRTGGTTLQHLTPPTCPPKRHHDKPSFLKNILRKRMNCGIYWQPRNVSKTHAEVLNKQ